MYFYFLNINYFRLSYTERKFCYDKNVKYIKTQFQIMYRMKTTLKTITPTK